MAQLRIIVVGLSLWFLSLLVPEMNLLLIPIIIIGVSAWFSLTLLIWVLENRHELISLPSIPKPKSMPNPSRPSRPISVAS